MPAQPTPGAGFGWAVDLAGDLALIGAPSTSGKAGATHLVDVPTATELAQLVPLDSQPDQFFGMDVALDGGRAYVSAPYDDAAAPNAGAVYVFDVATGAQLGKFVAFDAVPEGRFGASIAAASGRLVVGSPGDDDLGRYSGSAYVLDATTGATLYKVVASNGSELDAFGSAVEATSTRVLVGAPGKNNLRGAVYAFEAATGSELLSLVPDGTGAARIGSGLASDGARVLVGSRNSTSSTLLFDLTTGALLQEFSPTSDSFALHTGAVALAGRYALVGAPGVALADSFSGAVYIFDTVTGALVSRATPAQASPSAHLGFAVAADGSRFLAGAENQKVAGVQSGRATVFEFCDVLGTVYCGSTDENSIGEFATIQAFGSDVVADQELFLRAELLPADRTTLFLASTTQGLVMHPGGGLGTLCLGGNLARFAAQVKKSSFGGMAQIQVPMSAIPTNPPVAIQPGETWNFQAWYRDVFPSGPSNLTEALGVTFQ